MRVASESTRSARPCRSRWGRRRWCAHPRARPARSGRARSRSCCGRGTPRTLGTAPWPARWSCRRTAPPRRARRRWRRGWSASAAPAAAGRRWPGLRLPELLLLRRSFHRRHRRHPAGRDLGDLVEVTHAHELLVPHRRVAVSFRGELATLQLGVGRHPLVAILPRQLEHGVVQGVEGGEGDELELVAEGAELLLERADLGFAQLLAPVERGRAIVRE